MTTNDCHNAGMNPRGPKNRRELRQFLADDLAAYIHHRQFPVRGWRSLDWIRFPVIGWQRLLRKTEYVVNSKRGKLWKPYAAWRKGRFYGLPCC
ncbi:hypothetical protein [Acidobacterium sp. S8]|uniref:hypothetical protein n=1 Tax=Acidobacterium sp. S8 TaxID=1641854 RepID=UPI00131C00D2|nr:hypothetical protein [Acidobacterium sp. S8]